MSEFSRSANIRRLVLENPELTLEQLRSLYRERFNETIPDKPHILYQEKSNVRKRLGLEELTSLPQHNGRFNISGFLRDFCASFDEHEAIDFSAYFGIEVSSALYRTAMKLVERGDGPAVIKPTDFEPDANQHTGSRTRKKGKPGRKSAKSDIQTDSVTYETIEDSLDELIHRSSSLNPKLVQTLKNARRQVGAIILEAYFQTVDSMLTDLKKRTKSNTAGDTSH